MTEAIQEATVRVLKVPDPEFLLMRLKGRKEALILSGAGHEKLVGERLLMVNEILKEDEPARAFAFVSFTQEPKTITGIGALGSRKDSVDPLMLREFGEREGPIYILKLKLERALSSPRTLSKVPPGRFSSPIEFNEVSIEVISRDERKLFGHAVILEEAFHLRDVHWVPVPSDGTCPSSHPSKLKFPGTGTLRCFTSSAARVVRAQRESDIADVADMAIEATERKLAGLIQEDGEIIIEQEPEFQETVTPFKDLPLVSRTMSWDADNAKKNVRAWATTDDEIDFDKYGMAFLVIDGPKENLTSYKLPFADILDGRLQAIPRGVFAAAGVLQGARGGADLPPGDLERSRSHLGRYYSKMDLRAPWEPKESLSEQVEKLTNERAKLREAREDNPTERCKFCTYFDGPTTCKIIEGPVAADQVCDWIFSRETEAEQYSIADKDWIAFGKGMIKLQPYQHIVRDVAITPAGPVVMIEDTAKPPHRFSLTKKFHVEHTCVDEKTRAVTPEGLKSYKDLRVGDSVFCLDKRTGKLTTSSVKQILTHPHEGKLIHWKGHHYNFAVTPNHRVYCHLGRGQHGIQRVDKVRSMAIAGRTYQEIGERVEVSFDIVEAKDLRRRYQFFLPAPTGYEENSLRPIFRLPEQSGGGTLADEIPVDVFLQLAGWYVAEGWSSTKYGTFNLAAKKEDSVREIDSLVSQLGCHYRYSKIQFIIYRMALARLFGGLFGTCAAEKRIPAFIKNASRENLWAFLLCYLRGDGTLNDTGSWSATTVSPQLRDDLVEIAWKLGFVPGVWTKPAGRHFVVRKHYDCKEAYLVSAAPTLELPRGSGYSVTNVSGRGKRWSYLDHKGTVWCPVVEEHENWLMERDGKYIFTGNSLEHHWTQEEVDALVEVGKKEAAPESIPVNEARVLDALVLKEPHGRMIWEGKKTMIVRDKPLDLTSTVLIASRDRLFGIAELCQPITLSSSGFRLTSSQHQFSERDRRDEWPGHNEFYAYRIKSFEKFSPPRKFNRKGNRESVLRDVPLPAHI